MNINTCEKRSGQDRRCHVTADRRRDFSDAESNNRNRNTRFVANVSHEIRTPMQAILAMIDLLGETPLTQQQARYVDIFKDAGEHLLVLLNELLDYSRLESGEIPLNNKPFHLPWLVENVCELIRARARDKNIVVHYTIDPVLVSWRSGDAQRVRQILLNLADNAVKFTRDGEIDIRITAVNADRVSIAVTDTGAGIPELQQQRIFDAFVQGSVSHDQPLQGVGLGLAICKQLAKMMEGDVRVSSRPGVGSTFVCELLLPALSGAGVEMSSPDRISAAENFKLPALSVLVVDDSLLNCRVMEDLLGELGSTFCCVSNGQDAIKHLLSQHYDLVLMDMRMPVMDGLRATRTIRYLEQYFGCWMQVLHEIPVIALSASADPDERRAALAAGCNDYLVKPLRKAELTQVLVKYARDTQR